MQSMFFKTRENYVNFDDQNPKSNRKIFSLFVSVFFFCFLTFTSTANAAVELEFVGWLNSTTTQPAV